MPCYQPLHAFPTGKRTKKNKPDYAIKPRSAEMVNINQIKKPIAPGMIKWHNGNGYLTEYIPIPCGQCIGCRLEYSRQWAIRCVQEARQYEHNHFITLTYDPEHLPRGGLKPEHLTSFMKRLRRHYEYHHEHYNIRFFGAGEYGELTHRAHYHIIIFNLPIHDLKLVGQNFRGDRRYHSETISKLWGMGLIDIGAVNFDTAAYVARYIMKKQRGKAAAEYYANRRETPEFTRMSRRPGIGREWYEQNRDMIYENDEMFISRDRDGNVMAVKPAKYYDNLYDVENPEHMAKIKENRRMVAELATAGALRNTDNDAWDYERIVERNKTADIKTLQRKL